MSPELTKLKEKLALDQARATYMESVENAFLMGLSIEFRGPEDWQGWEICQKPSFYWSHYDYRVAIEKPSFPAIRQKILDEQSKLLETLYLSNYQKSVNECFRVILEFIG